MKNKKVHILKQIIGKPFDKVIIKYSKVLSLLTVDSSEVDGVTRGKKLRNVRIGKDIKSYKIIDDFDYELEYWYVKGEYYFTGDEFSLIKKQGEKYIFKKLSFLN